MTEKDKSQEELEKSDRIKEKQREINLQVKWYKERLTASEQHLRTVLKKNFKYIYFEPVAYISTHGHHLFVKNLFRKRKLIVEIEDKSRIKLLEPFIEAGYTLYTIKEKYIKSSDILSLEMANIRKLLMPEDLKKPKEENEEDSQVTVYKKFKKARDNYSCLDCQFYRKIVHEEKFGYCVKRNRNVSKRSVTCKDYSFSIRRRIAIDRWLAEEKKKNKIRNKQLD